MPQNCELNNCQLEKQIYVSKQSKKLICIIYILEQEKAQRNLLFKYFCLTLIYEAIIEQILWKPRIQYFHLCFLDWI